MSYDVFPDSEALIAAIIRDATGARVYSSIPKHPTYPLITIKRIGGIPPERHRLDRAHIQIDVWAGISSDANNDQTPKAELRDLAAEARTAIFESEGDAFSTIDDWPVDAVLTGVEDELGLVWLPEASSTTQVSRDHYVFAVAAFVHAA